MSKTLSLLMGIVSGGLLLLSFPQANLYGLAFFALVPYFVVILTQTKGKIALATVGYVGVFFGGLMNWVTYFHFIAYPGLVVATYGMYTATALICSSLLRRFPKARSLLIPAIWVSFEYLRTIGFLRFPYGNLGYSQAYFTPFIQAAEWGGHLGISFVVYLVNALLAEFALLWFYPKKYPLSFALKPLIFHFRPVLAAGFVFLVVYAYGKYKLSHPAASVRTVKVSLIQPWSDFNQRWSWEILENMQKKLLALSKLAKLTEPDLIVWPESALMTRYEYYLKLNRNFERNYEQYFKTFNKEGENIYFVVGSLNQNLVLPGRSPSQKPETIKGGKTTAASEKVKVYNSSLFIDPSGHIQARSYKMMLVPFAEWFPYLDYFPFLRKILESAQASQFTPGEKQEIFVHPLFRLAVLICYDDCFGDFSRRAVLKGADFLVVITNDAWAYSRKMEHLHNIFSIFRAVENRKPLVRSANAGVTCAINERGEIYRIAPLFEEAVLNADVSISDSNTFYTRHGNDPFRGLCLGIILLFLSGFIPLRRKQKA